MTHSSASLFITYLQGFLQREKATVICNLVAVSDDTHVCESLQAVQGMTRFDPTITVMCVFVVKISLC